MSQTLPFPEEICRAAQCAYIEPTVQTLLRFLPCPIALDIALPANGPMRYGAAALIKAAQSDAKLVVSPKSRIDPRAKDSSVTFRAESHSVTLQGEALGPLLPEASGSILEPILGQLLPKIFSHASLGQVIWKLSSVASITATLQQLTTFMLTTNQTSKALYAMLSGITTGSCLSFNRAILFRYDADAHAFDGDAAIGPLDASEARRIWGDLDRENPTIEQILQSDLQDSPLAQKVRQIHIPWPQEEDEIVRAIEHHQPLHLLHEGLKNPQLATLGSNGECVLAPLWAHQCLLGFLLADDYFSAQPGVCSITQERIDQLHFFVDQTALIWENLNLLALQHELATRDPLTGAFNRRRLDQDLALALSEQRPIALLILDVDHFKEINDRQGHAQGDWMLRGLAKVAQSQLRSEDLFARYGGDEFAILLFDGGAEAASKVAERIITQVRARLGITLSIGCGLYPGDAKTAEALFKTADERLYQAKNQGRDQYQGPRSAS